MTTNEYSFERYLNVRSAYAPGFSPDGKRLSFLTDITGVAEVWSIPIDIHAAIPAWPDQLTFRGERVTGASYSPTADVLLVSADVGGNERTQLYSLSADSSAFIALTTQSEAIYQFGAGLSHVHERHRTLLRSQRQSTSLVAGLQTVRASLIPATNATVATSMFTNLFWKRASPACFSSMMAQITLYATLQMVAMCW